MLYYQV